eukprot:s2101_g7.t2
MTERRFKHHSEHGEKALCWWTAPKQKSKLLQVRFEETKAPPTSFDVKRPPPIGVVKHPHGVRTRQGYHIEVKGTNEVIIALLHPSTVVIKGQLSCFLKSQAKWESISHAVWQMCFDEPSTEATRKLRRIQPRDAEMFALRRVKPTSTWLEWLLVASFCDAVPKLRVLPTEEELATFWAGGDRLDQAQLCLAIRQHLTRSAEGPWQLQARMLRVLISAFCRQPRGRALATSALAGSGEGLVRQLAAAEVPEVREEAARLVQLLELSRSLPTGESLLDVAKRGGLLSFTAAAPSTVPRRNAAEDARAPERPEATVDLLDLSPTAMRSTAISEASAVDRQRHSTIDAATAPAGTDELEQMYSFVLRPKVVIPYVPPREAKVATKSSDPFEFVSDHVRQMTASVVVYALAFVGQDVPEGPEARHKRQTRVLLQVMVPTFGQYELRFQWGMVPLTKQDVGLCRTVRCGVTQLDHPLRITLEAPRQEGLFKHLVPSLLHTSVQKYGYPVKHPLAEQFGMALLQPLRHRLKRGHEVRFVVYCQQGSEKEDLVKSVGDSKPTSTPGRDRRRESHLQEVLAEADWMVNDSVVTGELSSGPKQTSEALRHRIRKLLKACMRCGSSAGLVRIVAVMGNWQRVQLLSRRVLSGESITGDHSSNAEVHEALVRLTNEDTAQTIQLVVFQVGSDMALDELLAWRVENGRDKEPLSRKDTPPERAPVLGSTPRPNYWVLAEFQVDSLSTPVPYDEDEMLKPPPPPPDAIELIRNLEVGRAVKLEHETQQAGT